MPREKNNVLYMRVPEDMFSKVPRGKVDAFLSGYVEDPLLHSWWFILHEKEREIVLLLHYIDKVLTVRSGDYICYSKRTKSIFLIRGDQVG